MANERMTEALTEKLFHFHAGENDGFFVEAQAAVAVSKTGKGGKGRAEYLIHFNAYPETAAVIECKAQTAFHESADLNKPKDMAVDGVLSYAESLKEDYNVIALAVSGTEEEKLRISCFFWQKNAGRPMRKSFLENKILPIVKYPEIWRSESIQAQINIGEVRSLAIEFHHKLREAKLSEKQKPIFIAGILIALEDANFCSMYPRSVTVEDLSALLERTLEKVLKNSNIKDTSMNNILSAFRVIEGNPRLNSIPLYKEGSYKWYIEQIDSRIKPIIMDTKTSIDALGVFYHEFVKYAGGDGSGLGIVLTPQHLTEFMADLGDVSINTKVADIACGSGSFLVTALHRMIDLAATEEERRIIREDRIFGIEMNADIYVLAVANMIVRRDGKSNLIYGDCFAPETVAEFRHLIGAAGVDVCLLNPPYSQKNDKNELEFAEQALSFTKPGGKAVVVVPQSCAIGTKFKETRKRLFSRHTLKAVFTMPDEIFYPTGTNPCVMVWEAHKPHDSSVMTFFGYCKEDGFRKKKKFGRIDADGKWEAIKNEWLRLYKNQLEKPGLSARHAVRDTDEWLCEAYMETDYSALTERDFERALIETLKAGF